MGASIITRSGMKLLIFGFDGSMIKNPYVPHNHIKECIVYTGTHDNNTIKGWFDKEASPQDKERVYKYLGRQVTDQEISWEFVKLAMMSVADTAIVPIQDALGLGEEARMNLPAQPYGNWQWRLLPGQASLALAKKLADTSEIYGRA